MLNKGISLLGKSTTVTDGGASIGHPCQLSLSGIGHKRNGAAQSAGGQHCWRIDDELTLQDIGACEESLSKNICCPADGSFLGGLQAKKRKHANLRIK